MKGEPVDHRADIYSLACVLHECLAGEPPFHRETEVAALWAHVQDEPPRLSERRPELPSELDAVVRRALARSPEDRYWTCREFVRAAESVVGVLAERRPPTRPRSGTAKASRSARTVVLRFTDRLFWTLLYRRATQPLPLLALAAILSASFLLHWLFALLLVPLLGALVLATIAAIRGPRRLRVTLRQVRDMAATAPSALRRDLTLLGNAIDVALRTTEQVDDYLATTDRAALEHWLTHERRMLLYTSDPDARGRSERRVEELAARIERLDTLSERRADVGHTFEEVASTLPEVRARIDRAVREGVVPADVEHTTSALRDHVDASVNRLKKAFGSRT